MRKLGSLDLEKIYKDFIYFHNQYRSRNQIDDLKWNSEIAKIAQADSEKLALNPLERSSNTYKVEILGENLYKSKGIIGISGKEFTFQQYREVDNYDFSTHSPKIDRIAGYFTQLVWKETKNLEEIEC